MRGRHKDFTDEFKREAVRLSQESGRTVAEIAEDLGVAKSTLSRWRRELADQDLLSGPHEDPTKELARLRRENELLRQERDLLKKATAFFAKEQVRPRAPSVRASRPNDEVSPD